MQKTITVKGCGKVSVKPDTVILSFSLEAQDKQYDIAMEQAAVQIKQLNDCLVSIGYEKDAVKTTDFNVHTDYERIKGKDGEYHSLFKGFVCTHHLKILFDFQPQRLSQTLSSVSSCLSHPELSVAFTVKDPSAVNEMLLREATINARRKAEVLCSAANVKLGQLITIDYNWGELNVYSRSKYELSEDCLPCLAAPGAAAIDIEPDDVEASDTATFVWEIE